MVGQNVYQNDEIQFILERFIDGKEGTAITNEYFDKFGKRLTPNQLRYVKNKYGKDPKYNTAMINTNMGKKRKRPSDESGSEPKKPKPCTAETSPMAPSAKLPARAASNAPLAEPVLQTPAWTSAVSPSQTNISVDNAQQSMFQLLSPPESSSSALPYPHGYPLISSWDTGAPLAGLNSTHWDSNSSTMYPSPAIQSLTQNGHHILNSPLPEPRYRNIAGVLDTSQYMQSPSIHSPRLRPRAHGFQQLSRPTAQHHAQPGTNLYIPQPRALRNLAMQAPQPSAFESSVGDLNAHNVYASNEWYPLDSHYNSVMDESLPNTNMADMASQGFSTFNFTTTVSDRTPQAAFTGDLSSTPQDATMPSQLAQTQPLVNGHTWPGSYDTTGELLPATSDFTSLLRDTSVPAETHLSTTGPPGMDIGPKYSSSPVGEESEDSRLRIHPLVDPAMLEGGPEGGYILPELKREAPWYPEGDHVHGSGQDDGRTTQPPE